MISPPAAVVALLTDSPTDLVARYQALLDRPTPITAAETQDWLRAWADLDAAVDEAAARAQFLADGDIDNATYREEALRWRRDMVPPLAGAQAALKERVLQWPADQIPADLRPTLRRWQMEASLYREANIARFSAAAAHEVAVGQLLGRIEPQISGVVVPLEQAVAMLEHRDRTVREQTWIAIQEAVSAKRPALADHWRELWTLRQQIAHEAGESDFGTYMWKHYARSYDLDALRRFRAGIRDAAGRWMPHLMARRAAALGVPSVRPWDVTAPLGHEAQIDLGEFSQMRALGHTLLGRVTPEAATLATQMDEAGLRDEVGRPGKGPGAYMNILPVTRLPLIFGNYTASRRDLETLLHEMGHALHFARAQAKTPWGWAHLPPMEAAEVGSMALEALGLGQLRDGDIPGLTPAAIAAWQAAHAERNAVFLLYGLTVDEFQHRVYAHPEGWRLDVADAIWTEVWTSTPDGIDWSGLEGWRPARWWRQAHPWLYPFYYLDYAVALFGALSLGGYHQEAGTEAATQRYLAFLDQGHTEMLPDLFARLGVDLTFSEEVVRGTVESLCAQIDHHWTAAGIPPAPPLG